jgi:hypothetical protein
MTLVFAASQLNRQQYGVRVKPVLNTQQITQIYVFVRDTDKMEGGDLLTIIVDH